MLNLSSPAVVSLLLTNRCNLKCKHCIANSGEKLPVELTDEEVRQLIAEMAKNDVMAVDFNGGEPFMRDGLDSFIETAASLGLRVILTTNGTQLTEEWLDRHGENIWLLRTSIDSADPSDHDSFRGVAGSFEKTTSAIQSASSRGIQVTVLTTVHRGNAHNIDDLVELSVAIGAEGLFTALLMSEGRGEKLSDLVLTAEEVRRFCEHLLEVRERLQSQQTEFTIYEEVPEQVLLADHTLPLDARSCTAGVFSMSVTADGYGVPCASFSAFPELKTVSTDVKRNGIVGVWRDSPLFLALRSREGVGGKCEGCDYWHLCQGGCRVAAYAEHGDLASPDPWCWHNPAPRRTDSPIDG